MDHCTLIYKVVTVTFVCIQCIVKYCPISIIGCFAYQCKLFVGVGRGENPIWNGALN